MMATDPDPYLSLKQLSQYAGICVRTLQYRIKAPEHPLPHYRIGERIVVRRSEYDAWVQRFRQARAPVDVDAIVDDVLGSFR